MARAEVGLGMLRGTDRVVSINEAMRLTGISRSTIDRIEKLGDFPKRIKLSNRRVGWLESDLEDWVKKRKV